MGHLAKVIKISQPPSSWEKEKRHGGALPVLEVSNAPQENYGDPHDEQWHAKVDIDDEVERVEFSQQRKMLER